MKNNFYNNNRIGIIIIFVIACISTSLFSGWGTLLTRAFSGPYISENIKLLFNVSLIICVVVLILPLISIFIRSRLTGIIGLLSSLLLLIWFYDMPMHLFVVFFEYGHMEMAHFLYLLIFILYLLLIFISFMLTFNLLKPRTVK